MDGKILIEENAATSNQVAPGPENLPGPVETGRAPVIMYFSPMYNGNLNPNGKTAEERKTQILFYILLSLASVFCIVSLVLQFFSYTERFKENYWLGFKIVDIHQSIMILFAVVLQGYAILVYRMFPGVSQHTLKSVHFSLHALEALLMFIGLLFVYLERGGPRGTNHIFTQHSWAGMISFCCFLGQLFGGFLALLLPVLAAKIRDAFMPYHRVIGWLTYLMCCFTAMMGLNSGHFQADSTRDYLEKKVLLARFASLFLFLHVLIMIYLIIAPQFKRQPGRIFQ